MKTVKFPLTITETGVSARIRQVTQTKKGRVYTGYMVEYVLLGKRKQEWHSDFTEAKTAASDAYNRIANGSQLRLA